MLRDLAVKAIAIAVIAFAGMASSLSAGLGPEEPCGPENYGETFCEGCDVCYAQGVPHRLSTWTCTASHGWEEFIPRTTTTTIATTIGSCARPRRLDRCRVDPS